jgi:hypothetical protein
MGYGEEGAPWQQLGLGARGHAGRRVGEWAGGPGTYLMAGGNSSSNGRRRAGKGASHAQDKKDYRGNRYSVRRGVAGRGRGGGSGDLDWLRLNYCTARTSVAQCWDVQTVGSMTRLAIAGVAPGL